MILKRLLKRSLHKVGSFEPLLSHMRGSRLNHKIVVLMYHEIADDSDEIEAWTVVRKSEFIKQMEYLSVHFDILSTEEALARMETCHNSSYKKPAAVITFDDGYSGNNRVLLPIVKSMNLPVTLFVASRAIEEGHQYWYDHIINSLQGDPISLGLKRLGLGDYKINRYRGAENWREIERLLHDLKMLRPEARAAAVKNILAELWTPKANPYTLRSMTHDELVEVSGSPLMTIGAHSHCHNILTQIPEGEAMESVKTSRELLEKWTGRKVRYFSYPNGNFNDGVVGIVKELGFECAFTAEHKAWSKEDSVFTIPRIGVGRYDSLESFKIKVSGG